MSKKNIKINNDTVVTFGMLTEATDAVLNGIQGMFDDLNVKLDKRFDKIDLEAKYNHDTLQKQIDELKYDTPTRKEFNNLKDRFDMFYPTA